ncbi:vesicle-associated protein 2-1 isoform X2 [Citrus clementina]|uniref:vesicle-associated protein 2-1 isoform X2 n=1 Tax=Citrus clementina TaxID=85681 RepID=UPI000CED2129|nr:vesicle-associated protein 2-1 isoform X2 [Citrus x clementina]
MTADGGNQLISVHPEELKFIFELEKQGFCDLKVINNTEHHVAFKVKTTSPKKYFVRPNTGVVQPWDSCIIRVTLQAQRESPPDMQCKDKFLLQSTIVPSNTDVDDLPPDTALQRLKDERDAAVRQTQLLQQDLDMLKRRGQRKGVRGFSLMFAAFVGLIGIMVGLILNLLLSSPPPTVPQND